MLVVKRKTSESLVINDNIIVKIISCDNGNVKIGIDAPRDVSILRSELLDQIKKENEQATEIDINVLKDLNFDKNDL